MILFINSLEGRGVILEVVFTNALFLIGLILHLTLKLKIWKMRDRKCAEILPSMILNEA
jgi:hypothetical protein